jgi:hypothetical protein
MNALRLALATVLATFTLGATGCAEDLARVSIDAHRTNNFAIGQGQRIAVMTFAGDHGAAATDLVSMELMRKGIDVVDRDSLDRIVGEVRRAEDGSYSSDMSDAELFRLIGRVVGADVVIFGQTITVAPLVASRLGIAHRFRMTYKDFGDESPVYALGLCVLSMRAYSATTGEVVWWGTAETSIKAERGDHVRLLDYMRLSARNAAWALTDPSVQFDYREFDNDPIPR